MAPRRRALTELFERESRRDRMTGTVFDIGYQSYDGGPRRTRPLPSCGLTRTASRIALGFGRGARAKILPWFFIAVLSAIALVMALDRRRRRATRRAGLRGEANLPSHSDFYGIASIIMFVFAAVVGPELLCRDKRDGVINLYLVRPLTGTDYIVSRWAAFLSVMTVAAVWLPQIILFLGLCGRRPRADGVSREALARHPAVPRWPAWRWRRMPTTLSLLTASFTTRRAYASVFLVGLFVITTPFTVGLAAGDRRHGRPMDLDVQPHQHPGTRERLIFGDVSEITEEAPARAARPRWIRVSLVLRAGP